MTPQEFMDAGLVIFVGVLAASVAALLLVGRIRTRGLLDDKTTGRLSPARVQSLLGTLMIAGNLFSETVRTGDWPRQPAVMLATLGASHAVYLGAKGLSLARAAGLLARLFP